MKTSEILRKAKKLIPDEAHWWRGKFGQQNACECPITAISRVINRVEAGWDAREAFRKAIGDTDISTWNDAPERTFEEVRAAFDRAIKIAQEGF